MTAIKFGTVLGLLLFTEIGRADPLDTWIWRNPLPTGNDLNGIAYGNGQFAAVGDDPTILTSADGVDWIQRQSGTQNRLIGIAYGNGQFVAVGGLWYEAPCISGDCLPKSTIVTSADGVNWVERLAGTGYDLFGIAYGNGHFVAVGPGGTILQSGSIINLSITRSAGSGSLTLSLAGPTGLSYTIQTSADLISWRNLTNITSAQPTNIILEALPAASDQVFYRAYPQ